MPIYFFPDGTSSTAQLVLMNDRQETVRVYLRGSRDWCAWAESSAVMIQRGRESRPMTHPGRTRRSALTLLEVVLALAILAGSFATLAQLVGLGMRAAGNSRDLTTAQLLAESMMSEITAGILPTENLNRVPMDTHPGWLVSAIVDNTPYQGILRVTVITERETESYRACRLSAHPLDSRSQPGLADRRRGSSGRLQ